MKSIKSLMGRRQFLAAAGIASASALTYKRVGGAMDPVFQTGAAGVARNAGAKEKKQNTGDGGRYSHLLSPIKIGNVILKNRMIHSRSLPHFLQGPETFPSEAVISHYAGVARNGAAIVTVKGGKASLSDRKTLQGDMAHMTMWDVSDPAVQNYYAQLADAIHFYGSLASIGLNISMPSGYAISESSGSTGGGSGGVPVGGAPGNNAGGAGGAPGGAMPSGGGGNPTMVMGGMSSGKEITEDLIQEMIESSVTQARFYQGLGYDMVNIYMSYRAHMLAHALSPALNKRTDKYGGSLENRARFPLELFQAIKKACGQDFLIEAQISGEEVAGGYTVADVVEYAKIWEDSLDILQLRATDATAAHPTGFNSKKVHPITLDYSEAVKKGGAKIVTAPIGGFQDPGLCEEFIADGKTDMIAMARAFICDPEYGKKACEGRGEDVVPCLLCNDCHGINKEGPWFSFCSVNPKLGIAHRVGRMVDVPSGTRKVAIIGGGPAGMQAALTCSERGHSVTLYEKNDFLGGQIRYSDFASFKWPLKNYKDYLIAQIKKAGVTVHINTKATPEMIKAKGFDAVIVAAGAEPIIPDMPGADGSNVRPPIFVYGNEKALGKNVVVISGRQIAVETGIYLTENGHNVTVLTDENALASDANTIHFIDALREAYEAQKAFSYITGASVTGISKEKVTYRDARGDEKSIKSDSVVIYAGRRPRHEEAMKFYGTADRFFIIGDCQKEGNVRTAVRTAFAAASQI